MKKIFITVAVLLSAIILLTAIFFVYSFKKTHNRSTAGDTVYSFIYALNNQNINDMLSCIEPSEAQIIEYAISKADDKIGSGTFSKLKNWLPFLSDFADVNLIPKFDLSIISTEVNDDTAAVTASLTGKESQNTYKCVFHLIKIETNWYIQYATKS